MHRIVQQVEPFVTPPETRWYEHGRWPAWWVDMPGRSREWPSFALFRLSFSTSDTATVRVHVSADNRYLLYCDGHLLGRGPERGEPEHWYFESYQLTLAPGEHQFIAMQWWLGEAAPFAQMSIRPGFLLAGEGEWIPRLSTGVAPWECQVFAGIRCRREGFLEKFENLSRLTGTRFILDAASYPWGWESGDSAGSWQPVENIHQGLSAALTMNALPYWKLAPAPLPAMAHTPRTTGEVRHVSALPDPYPLAENAHMVGEAAAWQAWLQHRQAVTIPAHTQRTVIIDLHDYACAYPTLILSGGAGAAISLAWSETLYRDALGETKGHRDEVYGKYFLGDGDLMLADGGAQRRFTPPWWNAGRYLELRIDTTDSAVTLDALELHETGYPLIKEAQFDSADARLADTWALSERTLRKCMHETYMDCPYFEQLMYAGDTRIQLLMTYMLTRDTRLPRKAMETFDRSRRPSGLTLSSYPILMPQSIPPFSLWWVMMVYDYWLWRDDHAFVAARMPGVRAVLEYFRSLLRPDGLLDAPYGWNLVDWAPDWQQGVPTHGDFVPSSIINLHAVLTLLRKAEMEDSFGEGLLAERDRELAYSIFAAVERHFWRDDRGFFADTLQEERFSEHAQVLAVLCGLLGADRQTRIAGNLLQADDLTRTTIYFSHYLFEAFALLGLPNAMLQRLDFWFALPALGMKTLPESPEPGRSDCHAWGGHPIYHYFATLLGIRPATAGFGTVRIAPQPGHLPWLSGTLPHPTGDISLHLQQNGHGITAKILLPETLEGEFIWRETILPLQGGENRIQLME